jgi:acetyl-CoA C-acetyltransferase
MTSSHDAVIVAGARTAIATSYKGTLVDVDALELGTKTVAEALRRSGLAPELIDDVILGESLYGGGAIARYAAVAAGITSAPGVAQNRHCASGLATISAASGSIMAGMDRAIIAGGVQSSSTAPVVNRRVPGTENDWDEDWLAPSHPETADAPIRDMSITVGWNAAYKRGLTRRDLDEWSLRSHQRAIAGIDNGSFVEEIFALDVTKRDGTQVTFDVDEHPRRGSTLEKLESLKPLHPEIEGFNITAGNAAGINDAGGAVVVTSREFAASHGLTPMATIKSWASVGVDPADTGLAPAPAIRKALDRAGISLGDVSLFEINEAFASVAVAATRELGLNEDIVNVLGSGCSLGHPVAMTGARMVLTLTHELRRRGGGIGVAAMCAGGGMGSALVFEV